jgi:O-6-methylguanine DNA methyltransferase
MWVLTGSATTRSSPSRADSWRPTSAATWSSSTCTPFQQEVWAALRTIPYGEVRSYGDIADQIGRPKAVRAVGLANGRNPISIIVPCHRVIGASGALTGYGGGIERKRALLDLEATTSGLYQFQP